METCNKYNDIKVINRFDYKRRFSIIYRVDMSNTNYCIVSWVVKLIVITN